MYDARRQVAASQQGCDAIFFNNGVVLVRSEVYRSVCYVHQSDLEGRKDGVVGSELGSPYFGSTDFIAQ